MEAIFSILNGATRLIKPARLLPKELIPSTLNSFGGFMRNIGAILAHYWIFSLIMAVLLVLAIITFLIPVLLDWAGMKRTHELSKLKKWIFTTLRCFFLVCMGLIMSTAIICYVSRENGISNEMPAAFQTRRRDIEKFAAGVLQEYETNLLGTFPFLKGKIINLFHEHVMEVVDSLEKIDQNIHILEHFQNMESIFRNGSVIANYMGNSLRELISKEKKFEGSLMKWKKETGAALDDCSHPDCIELKQTIALNFDFELDFAELPDFRFMSSHTIYFFYIAAAEVASRLKILRKHNISKSIDNLVLKEIQPNISWIVQQAEQTLMEIVREIKFKFNEEAFLKSSSQDDQFESRIQEFFVNHILQNTGIGMICGMILIVIGCTVELLYGRIRLPIIGSALFKGFKGLMAVTFLAVIGITSINGLIGMMVDPFVCDLVPNLGTGNSQTEILEAIFPEKEGVILRGCSMNETLARVLGIDPIFNPSVFANSGTCKRIAVTINEASSGIKTVRRRKLHYWTPEHVVKLRNFTEFEMWDNNITTLLIGMKKGTSVLDADMAATAAKLYATADVVQHLQVEKKQHVAKMLRKSADELVVLANQHLTPLRLDLKKFKYPSMDIIFGWNRTGLKKEVHQMIDEVDGMILFQNEAPKLINQIAPKFLEKCDQEVEEYATQLKEIATEVGRCGPVFEASNNTMGFLCRKIVTPGNGLWIITPMFQIGFLSFSLVALLALRCRQNSFGVDDDQQDRSAGTPVAGVMNETIALEEFHG